MKPKGTATGLVVLTHGKIGCSLIEVAEFILGQSLAEIRVISFRQSAMEETAENEIQETIGSANQGQGVLVINGSLSVQGGFEFYGPVIVRKSLKTTGTGNFSNGSYWSSSQMTSVFAWQVIFGNGNTQGGTKSNLTSVRAVRAF